jgi:hypothetical protein
MRIGTIVATLSLALLGGCTTMKSTAQQPTDGSRSRIRLAGFADQMEIDVVQPNGRKGTLYTRSGFYPGDVGKLGMPAGPTGEQGRNEYYIVGDQDVTVRVNVAHVVQQTPSSQLQSVCKVSGSFHVDAAKDYEVRPMVLAQPDSPKKIALCAIAAIELVSKPDGRTSFERLRVTPIATR